MYKYKMVFSFVIAPHVVVYRHAVIINLTNLILNHISLFYTLLRIKAKLYCTVMLSHCVTYYIIITFHEVTFFKHLFSHLFSWSLRPYRAGGHVVCEFRWTPTALRAPVITELQVIFIQFQCLLFYYHRHLSVGYFWAKSGISGGSLGLGSGLG